MTFLRTLVAAATATAAVLASSGPASAADRILHTEGKQVVEAGTGRPVAYGSGMGNANSVDQSPDGARLAVGTGGGTWRESGAVTVFGAEGGCPVELPGDARGGVSWAPDSVRLAIGASDGLRIVDTGVPGMPTRPVLGATRGDWPAWHPFRTADRIAFSRWMPEGDADIAVVHATNGDVVTLVGGPTYDTMPAFSPDGQRLAWIRSVSGQRTLWVGGAMGEQPRQVTDPGSQPVTPRWSRDSRTILVGTEAFGGDNGIFRVDPATGAMTRLTSGEHRSPVEAPLQRRHGYAVVAADGQAYGFGASCSAGPGLRAVAVASNAAAPGHWQVDAAGRVRALGASAHHGDLAGMRLNQPIVGIAGTPSGQGYWLVARDGGIFSFGDAVFRGSTGAVRLNQPIVGMAAVPDGRGYWLVAADGGIFSFGSARFHGSTGAMRLNQPIVGMRPTPDGTGYWLVARDGGIFTFGDAVFAGSTGGFRLNQPIIGMAGIAGRAGYYLVAADGGVFTFGDHPYLGSTGAVRIAGPAAGIVVETVG